MSVKFSLPTCMAEWLDGHGIIRTTRFNPINTTNVVNITIVKKGNKQLYLYINGEKTPQYGAENFALGEQGDAVSWGRTVWEEES
ncbi:hypothetical protein [Listeria phage LP-KV022]|uniref:Uncharacterized protein n=2 Tax=Homburgvirus LP110 TaxID=1921128 RepID=A0A5A4K4T3_9CAUD|nr:hypothetical protein LP110_051 [Listeria phage LP-110]AGI11554.1 hypothetical protein LP110_051 [Listeria phage LP-110]AWY07744.1 hypothetical protein [Listeria phage LP-KV022]